MPITTNPEWQQLALYAVGAALLLILLFNIPYVGRVLRSLFLITLLTFCFFVIFQQAPFDPRLARLTTWLGLDRQAVVGKEVRIRVARDGHFWAQASVNGIDRRMLVDSGAAVTALSQASADLASVERGVGLLPVILHTANGAVKAETGTVEHFRLGNIEAHNLNVVVSPALGSVDILGMNFLSQLESWRVEDGVLILVPRRLQSS